jgi:magnesium-transporting ATPase (P-type)
VKQCIDKPQLSQQIHTVPKENKFQKQNRHEQSSTMQIVVILLLAFLPVYFDSPLQVSAELFDPMPSTNMKTQFLFISQTYLFIPSIILVGIFLHRIKTFLVRNIAVWATILIVMFFLSLSIYVVTELSDLLLDLLERFIFSYLWPHLEVDVFFPGEYLICV